MVELNKQLLRATMRKRRQQLQANEQQKFSAAICDTIESLPCFQCAQTIAIYQAFSGEVNLSSLLKSCSLLKKKCCLPAIMPDKTLNFLPVNPNTPFKKNRYGIEEPLIELQYSIPIARLDLIFVPLVAFDKQGNRLGMGAGYYDRTFANSPNPPLIGVAYDFQQVEDLAPAAWDIPMQAVITEKQIYWTKK